MAHIALFLVVPLSESALRALPAPDQSQPADYILQRFLAVDPVEDPLVVYARLAVRAGNVTADVGTEVLVEKDVTL